MAVITNPIVLNSTVEDTNAILIENKCNTFSYASKSGGLTRLRLAIYKNCTIGLAPQVVFNRRSDLVPWKDVADNNKEYSWF